MGYYVSYNICASFKKEDSDKVLAAINALHEPELMKKQASGGSLKEHHYSWVDNPPAGGWTEIEEAFYAWRFELSDERGWFTFYWTGEKLGDEEYFFEAIAQWLTGEIYARGEGDDDEWGFSFHDGKMTSLKCIREWIEI